jgi:hypothetical protein
MARKKRRSVPASILVVEHDLSLVSCCVGDQDYIRNISDESVTAAYHQSILEIERYRIYLYGTG